MFLYPAHNYFFIWQWLTIFGIWVFHHEKMWHIQLCFWFDVDLWPQGQIYRLLSCLHVRLVTSVRFDIGLPYLAHGSITMRGCVKYIHGPNTMFTFDLKVKFIGFMTWLCVQALAFLSLDILLLCLAHGSITKRGCAKYNHDLNMTLTFDLKVKFIGFMTWFCVRATTFLSIDIGILFLHMSVSPWYNVSIIFITSVWPWPLISISKLYSHHEFESGKMFLLFDIRIPHFGLWVYHH